MRLTKLNLTNFRNYSNLKLEFDEKPTIMVGNNGAGKSNILEAIYFLSTTKSPRVDLDSELINQIADFTRIEGGLEDNGMVELVIVMTNGGESRFSKRVMVNGVGKRVVEYVGTLPAIFFLPSDIEMITGSPSLRRWHLDLGLAQVDKEYKKALTLYETILTSRNKVLKRIKEGEGGLNELTYWSDELLKYGLIVSQKRVQFFTFINQLKTPLGEFNFAYKSSEISAARLEEYRNREITAAVTLIGPHRDDFFFLVEEKNLAHFGSRGEQREATVAFKLAQLEYMASILDKRPLLLLDDVFSELDAIHRQHIAEVASLQQTFISTIELEEVPEGLLKNARILKVESGRISVWSQV